ncbi:MAG: hypothetical protein KGQ59_04925 [Bdellovibrionales bacterium]|nr:hypothetical protein [Bdellovibrionales bacterium]
MMPLFASSLTALVLLVLGTLSEGLSSRALAAEARVLPQGRSRLALIQGRTATITDTTTSDGERVSIMSPFQLELSGQNFRRADPRVSDLVQWLNNQNNYRYNVLDTTAYGVVLSNDSNLPRLGDALSRGSLGLDAEVNRSQYVVAYQYGFTPRLSAGFAVPIIKQSVRFRHSINGRNTARDIYEGFARGAASMGATAQLVSGLQLLSQIDTETFQTVLASRGYKRFEDFEASGLGDGILGSRYLYLEQNNRLGLFMNAFQTQVTVPIGRLASPDNLTELDFGTGAWTGQLIHTSTYTFKGRYSLSHQLGYTAKLPFSRLRRVPSQPGDFLPGPANEESVRIKLGDQWMTSAGMKAQLNPTVSLDSQIFWEWKGRDTISGSKQAASVYDYMSEGTESMNCYAQFSVVASSISAFLRNRFLIPGDLTLTWSQPISGRNQIVTPYGIAELALYF